MDVKGLSVRYISGADWAYYILFLSFVSFYCISLFFWVSVPGRLFVADGIGMLNTSFDVFDRLKDDPTDFFNTFLNTITLRKPPVFPFSFALGYLLLGKSLQTAWMVTICFMVLTCYFLYKIGEFFNNPKIGIIASVIMLGFHPMSISPTILGVETPTTTFLVISIYLTLKTDSLRKTKWTIMLAISLILGLLTRIEFILFYLPFGTPYLYNFLKGALDGKTDEKRPFHGNYGKFLVNIFLLLTVTTVLTAPWLLQNIKEALFSTILLAYNTQKDSFMERILDADNILYYPKAYYNFSPVLFSLSIIALTHSLVDRQKKDKSERYLNYAIIFAYIAYQTVRIREARFLIPMLPLLGIQAGILLTRMKDKIIANAIFIIILATSTMNVYNEFLLFHDGRLTTKPGNIGMFVEIQETMRIIEKNIGEDSFPKSTNITVTIISDIDIWPNVMNYLAKRDGISLYANRPSYNVTMGMPYDLGSFDYTRILLGSNFVIKNNDTRCKFSYMNISDCDIFTQNLAERFDAHRNRFVKIGQVSSERDGEVEIYRKIGMAE